MTWGPRPSDYRTTVYANEKPPAGIKVKRVKHVKLTIPFQLFPVRELQQSRPSGGILQLDQTYDTWANMSWPDLPLNVGEPGRLSS